MRFSVKAESEGDPPTLKALRPFGHIFMSILNEQLILTFPMILVDEFPPKAMRIRLYLTHYSYSGPSGGLWAVSLGELNGSVYSLPPRIGHPPPCHEK